MEAIILAGGLGTRLRSVVSAVPKSMAPVCGRPFIEYIMDRLIIQGINKIILAVGYKRDIIMSHFGMIYKNIPLAYSVEENPLGTGGAIKKALKLCQNKPVIVINGDTYVDVDTKHAFAVLARNNADVVIAIKEMVNFSRYGTITIDDCNKIIGFNEKRYCPKGYINTGFYVLNPTLLLKKGENVFSFEKDILQNEARKTKMCVFKTCGRFIDIGVPEDYALAQKIFVNWRNI